ncbi:MAG TPA: hypothetical protein VGJ92_07600 [Methanocella sp.]
MKRFHVHTTLSARHRELLKKHQERLETSQQKVLELALDSLENSPKSGTPLSPEMELWMRIGKELKPTIVIVEKEVMQILLKTADTERLASTMSRDRHIGYEIQYYLKKPLKECSLEEIIDGLIVTTRLANWMDAVITKEESDHYSIIITHSTGLESSKLFMTGYQSLFDSCGIRCEGNISEKNIFLKIYKNKQ